jgi:WD40 repeat protein
MPNLDKTVSPRRAMHFFTFATLVAYLAFFPCLCNSRAADSDPKPMRRFGAERFTLAFYPNSLAYSPDGKLLAAVDFYVTEACVWKVATGKQLWSKRFDERATNEIRDLQPCFSPDSKYLLMDTKRGIVLHALTGKDASRELVLPVDRRERNAMISPDLRSLITQGDFFEHYLCVRGHSPPLELPGNSLFTYSADGKHFFCVDPQNENSTVERIFACDAIKQQAVAYAELKDHYIQRLQPSPDGKRCWIWCNGWKLFRWDVDTAHKPELVNQYPLSRSESGLRDSRMLLSPDATKVLIVDRGFYYHVIDAKTARPYFKPKFWQGYTYAFSPDSRSLAIGYGGALRFVDVATGAMTPVEQHGGSVQSLLLEADGKTLLAAGGDEIRRWDIATGQSLARLLVPPAYSSSEQLVAGGRIVDILDGNRNREAFDLSTGRFVDLSQRLSSWTTDVAHESNVFASGASAAAASQIPKPDPKPGDRTVSIRTWDKHANAPGAALTLGHAPLFIKYLNDARQLLVFSNEIALYDVATGAKLQILVPSTESSVYPAPFSTSIDGSRVTFVDRRHYRSPLRLIYRGVAKPEPNLVHFEQWRIRSGKAVPLAPIAIDAAPWQLTRDGRRAWIRSDRGPLKLVELDTGLVLHELPNLNPTALVTSPDARRAFVGQADGAITIWSLAPLNAETPSIEVAAESAQHLEGEWNDLISDDGKRIYRASWRLSQLGDRAISFITQKLNTIEPTPMPDQKQIAQWVADLGSEVHRVRAAASTQLLQAIPAARDSMTQALSDSTVSPIAKSRLRLLVASPPQSNDRVRTVMGRACTILEQIGTPAAKESLALLARHHANAVSEEASTALARWPQPESTFALATQLHKPYVGIAWDSWSSSCKVAGVISESPAAKADFKPGDTILKVDGQAVRNVGEFAAIVRRSEIGATLHFTFRRDNEERETQCQVEQRPD